MTLFEQVTEALKQIDPDRGRVFIEMANQWMYGNRSANLDYGVRVETKLFKTEERITRARRAFLQHVLDSVNHDLKRKDVTT